MTNHEFVAYVGCPDIHDGTIERVLRRGDDVIVEIQADSGRRFSIRFINVHRLDSRNAKGMLLYALCELTCDEPGRHFHFARWDDQYDGDLNIIADDIQVLEDAPGD